MEKRERPLAASTTNSLDEFWIEPESGVFDYNAPITSTIQGLWLEAKPEIEVSIKCAGRCWPNPGGIGVWAFVVFDSDGNMKHQAYGDIGYGEGVTNNVAAYQAIIEVLNWVSSKPEIHNIEILSDSQLAVNQINGDWNCKTPHLQRMNQEIYELRSLMRLSDVCWISLKENGGADALCQLAYKKALRKYKGGDNG